MTNIKFVVRVSHGGTRDTDLTPKRGAKVQTASLPETTRFA